MSTRRLAAMDERVNVQKLKQFSYNQTLAIKKNRIYDTMLEKELKNLKLENYFNCLEIKKTKREVQIAAKTLRLHTGNDYYIRENIRSAPPRLTSDRSGNTIKITSKLIKYSCYNLKASTNFNFLFKNIKFKKRVGKVFFSEIK
jgi:hypothetical protein